MPDCSEIASLLSDYLDRDLPPETCTVVDAHLQSCVRCENAASELRRTIALCRKRGRTPLGAGRRAGRKLAFRPRTEGPARDREEQ